MIFDTLSITAYVVGLLLLYLLCWIFIKPLKRVGKLLLSGVLGGFTLAAINLVGKLMGLHIPINPLSAFITGILGVPGVVLLIVLQFILP